jgi:hypothetical protein
VLILSLALASCSSGGGGSSAPKPEQKHIKITGIPQTVFTGTGASSPYYFAVSLIPHGKMDQVIGDPSLIVASNGWKTDYYADFDVDLWDTNGKWTGTGTFDVGFAIWSGSDVPDVSNPDISKVKAAYIKDSVSITDTITTVKWDSSFKTYP